MENTLLAITLFKFDKRKYKGLPLLFCSFVFLVLFHSAINAQGSTESNKCIENNTIELKPPVCSANLMLLKGSIPKGGTGSFKFKWEVNSNGNCSENGFEEIPGATGPDYNIPLSSDLKRCYRRIVISGNCRDESNKINTTGKADLDPVLPTIQITQPTCDKPTGTITVNPPVPAIGFSIDGINYNNTNGVFSGLVPKTYTVTVRYATGCTSPKVTVSIKAVPASPRGSISPTSAVLCEGESQLLTVTGGSTYQWYLNNTPIAGANAATYNAKSPGQYSAIIFNGSCSSPASNKVTISRNSAITFNAAIVDPNCTISTGVITVNTVSGGSGRGYRYSKDGGITYQVENTFRNLRPGQYALVIKDEAECKSAAKTVTIKQATNALKASVLTGDATCGQSNGTATITITGGRPPYAYRLIGATEQKDNVFRNLPAGTYKVLVKDAASCSTEVGFTIKQTNSALSATATVKNPACGQTTGSVSIKPANGARSYQYSLDKGSYQASATFENVTIGKHLVTVKDNAGCTADVPFEIKAAGPTPQLVIATPLLICVGATVNLKDDAITAGSDMGLTFTYWTNAAATVALSNPEKTSAGTYYIKAENSTGCFVIKPVVVSEESTPAGSITPVNPATACSGDSVVLTASTGVSYQWYKNDIAISGANNSTYKVMQEGKYSVLIKNGTCAELAANVVTVRFQACIPAIETKVFVPSAFTPNRNSKNDLLQPYLLNIRHLVQFKVFNRWGQQVYQTNVIGEGWDGTFKGMQQPAEIYSWILECVDFDGKVIKQSGRSLLIR